MAVSYFYVKNGGTAGGGDGGRVATARTGTWNASTADYYDSLFEVFDAGTGPTTLPAAGDIIFVSHLHLKTAAVGPTLSAINMTIYSVDNANQENYLKGAIEDADATSASDYDIDPITLGYTSIFYGCIFKARDRVHVCTAGESGITYVECDFYLTTSIATSIIYANQNRSTISFIWCNFHFTHIDQNFLMLHARLIFINCGIVAGSSAITVMLEGGAGGADIFMDNCDYSGLATSGSLVDMGDIVTDDYINLDINRVLLPSGTSIIKDTILSFRLTLKATSIGFGTATDTYHYFFWENILGTIEEDTAIYRDAGSTYDGTNNFSAEMVGSANNSYNIPLKFQLTSFYIDTADYITDITFTVHLARDNGTLLQDDEFWIEVEHCDGADNALGVLVDTKPAPLVAGTNLTNEAGGWTHNFTGSEGTDFEFMSANSGAITIGTAAGNIASGAVRVNVYLAINDTVFVCGKVEVT